MQDAFKTRERIWQQQIRLLYSQSTTAVVVSLGVALLTAYCFWHGQNGGHLTAWLALLLVLSVCRLFLFSQFSIRKPKNSELAGWLKWHIGASFLGGAAWGALGYSYDPYWNTGQQVVLFVVIAGMATSAISSYAAVLRSYIAFLIPLLFPLTVRLATVDSPDAHILFLIVLVFAAGIFAVASNFHSHVVKTLRLINEQESLQEAVRSGTKNLQKTQQDLHTTERRFGHVLESSLDGFWDWDIVHDKVYFSPRYKQQLGFKDHELVNKFATWESHLHPDDKESILARVNAYLNKPWGYWEEEFRLRHKDGSYKWILARAVPTLDSDAKPIKLTGVHIDISDRVKAERKIRFLAFHDWLTKLPNRTLLNERLEHALTRAQRARTQVSILYIDLDRFKHVNDSLGHPAGDSVLRKVAKRFVEQLREEDTIARISGDEFAVLIEDVTESRNVVVIAEKLLFSLKRAFIEEDHTFYLNASIGISVFPNDGRESATLLKNADAAMHRAKSIGRNRFQFYSEDLTNTALKSITLEYGLRQALLKSQLRVYYQPKMCLRSGRILGAEALLRWIHPEEGFISPEDFIPVAEESGLIMEIGEWVLQRACLDAASWRVKGLIFDHIAVNISGVQVQHVEFVQSVRNTLALSGLPARNLELEVTENCLMRDADVSARLLGDLREVGISIAIDDFGTGYSSLAYLTRFRVNKVKIDRTFIRKLCNDEHDAEISRAIISLGHTLNMKVVAEGIETDEHLEFLKAEGCDEGQGYLIAQPLPHDEFVAFLEHHTQRVTDLSSAGASTDHPTFVPA